MQRDTNKILRSMIACILDGLLSHDVDISLKEKVREIHYLNTYKKRKKMSMWERNMSTNKHTREHEIYTHLEREEWS